jgi:hypothetical protein
LSTKKRASGYGAGYPEKVKFSYNEKWIAALQADHDPERTGNGRRRRESSGSGFNLLIPQTSETVRRCGGLCPVDTRPHVENTRPHVEDTRPHVEDTRPHVENTRSHVENTRQHVKVYV